MVYLLIGSHTCDFSETLEGDQLDGVARLSKLLLVDLVQGEVSRQVRRNLERHGHKIEPSLVVSVRMGSRRYTYENDSGGPSTNGNGGSIDYSHRFEVRSHYKHFNPGTRMALANPNEVKPCWRRDPRTHELTCPLGCRRIHVPSFVKGPEDKPFIPKTRRLAAPSS